MSKKTVPFIEINKPPVNLRETMNRAQKAFRNRWNTEKKPYTPTPKQEGKK